MSLDLMEKRLSALYVRDYRGRILTHNQWTGGRAPRLHLARTADGVAMRFRNDVPDSLVHELEAVAADERCGAALTREPHGRSRYLALLATRAPSGDVAAGPVFVCRQRLDVAEPVVAVTRDRADLLQGPLAAWLPDVPHRQPFLAALGDGRAIAVCASVRIGPECHEAGVETLPDWRRMGHASNVVAAWANAVLELGATPCYSTSWKNEASIGVARRLGLRQLGVDFTIY